HDWAEGWKQYFKPLKIGRRLWIVPTWETTFEPPRGSLVLLCDPGMAFGTGQHATTSLCLKAIELFADTWVPADKARAQVLDFGCGTGILGIAAAKLGFGRVVGIDNDPLAVQATDDNIRLNGVADRMAASDAAVGDVGETFDLVVANILAVTLNELADLVLRRVKPGGTLVLSGILATQADEVIRTYERAAGRAALPFRFEGRWTHGEWVALRFHAS
ncbi:MAG TPA: 50S ribosomal protein L11 methyltransferase, partial [Myxococcota bacterium]|nr:50S ribosomal protein L11 methyltransferase [Myxococcota bacterium]